MNKGIVSTGSKEATYAAVNILESGGNAIDAAVAAVFTSMTSEFALTGIGGGGSMMVKTSDSEPIIYDFFVDTPKGCTTENIDFYSTTIDFGDSKQLFHIGKGSVAVPGNLAGLIRVHNDFGTLPLSTILEPAIDLAREGYILNKEQAYIFKILEPIFTHTKLAKQLLYRGNCPLSEGDKFINIEFANFLERVLKEGIEFFYKGQVARLIEKSLSDGGLLNVESLKNYQVKIRKPVSTLFQNHRIYSNPSPSAGGSLIIFLIKILENIDKNNYSLPNLVNAMALTDTARGKICNDANNVMQFNKLLDDKIIHNFLNENLFKRLDKKHDNDNLNRGCTTHVSVIDKNHNCASVTTSNGEGSGYIIPGTGIMLNNMLGEEDLNPQGFHNWNCQRRLSTMMSPTIVTLKGKPKIIIGSGGSNRIRSAIVQVLINYIYNGMSLNASIESSRIHLENNNLYYEPGIDIVANKLIDNLNYYPFDEKNLFFGGVNAVTLNDGHSDSRRGGFSKVI